MVADGYRQTDIGVIPDEWNQVSLGSLGLFSKGSGIKKDEAKSGSLPCVRYGELYTHHNDYVKKYNSYISKTVSKGAKKLKHGDILFAGSGETKEEIGKCAAFLGQEEAYAGGDIVILSPRNINSKFLGYLLNTPVISKQKASKGQGDAVVHISANSLANIQLPIPPKQEQQAIATVLSDTDELINSLEKLIAKKEAIKTGTMQELLTGKKRLDGFSGEWEEKKLGELARITRGASPRPIESPIWFNNQSEVGWVRISDVTKSNKYLFNTVQKLSKKGIENSRYVEKNNLIMSICATLGRPILTTTNVCIHDGFVYFKNLIIDHEYLYYFLSFVQSNWTKNGQTGSQANLNTDLINKTNIYLSNDTREQQAIATILSDMDSDIEALKTKLSKVKAIKKGMTQVLLTGRVRLV